nr:hypothetical protein [Seohaeicola saemankumensis]
MSNSHVMGVYAPPPKVTKAAALVCAAALSIPVLVVLSLVQVVW